MKPNSSDELVPYTVSATALDRNRTVAFSREDAETEMATTGLFEYWRIIQRRKGTVVIVAFLGMVAAFLYTLPQTPVYQASTVIEVDNVNEDFLHMREVNPTQSGGWDPVYDLQTQVKILESNSLRERVVKRLNSDSKPLVTIPSRLNAWRKALNLASPDVSTAREQAIKAIDLHVRVEPNTRLIVATCDSTNPQMAAEFANSLTSEFIEQNLETRWQTTQHTGEWLARQMEDLKIKLERSEDAMQAYARANGLVFTQDKGNAAEEKMKELQSELSKAQGDRISKQSRYELAAHAPPESLAEVLGDSNLQEIQGKLTDLRREYAEASATYTAANPKVKKLQAQIAPLETALERQRSAIIGSIQNDYEAAQHRERLLAADYTAASQEVSNQGDRVNHYNMLKAEADTNRQLFDNMQQRVKEAGIASALRASNIHVVDPANIPKSPYKPNLLRQTLLGLICGIFFGIVLVVYLERVDRTVQEPGDAALFLGVPELGIIPSEAVETKRRLLTQNSLAADANTTEANGLMVMQRKSSAMAEAFRSTLTSILFAGAHGECPKVLVLSSSAPREGKSTISSNLAVALAEIHKRVLLIDADLRRPRMHHIFGLTNETGLVDLLRQREPLVSQLNGSVQQTSIPNLSVMTSGQSGQGDTTLLHSMRIAELVELARKQFDMVLIDTPPMLTMADARVIARHSDGVILVTRANQTSRDSIKDAAHRFTEDGVHIIGTILNDWNPKKSGRYGYYKYYDKYKHYYSASAE